MISDISKIPAGENTLSPSVSAGEASLECHARPTRQNAPSEREPRTPEMIGAEIRMYVDAGRRITLLCGIEIGRRLVEAKEMLNHGEWLPWLKRETEFSERSAQNYMKVFNSYGAAQLGLFGPETNTQAFADLPITKALAMLSIPESEREDFAAEVGAESLSVRELEEKVRERTDELRAAKEEAEAAARGAVAELREADTAREAAEIARKEAENAREVAEIARRDAENDREAAEKAQRDAEEQLRRIKAELDEIEKRPAATVYVPDEEAIAKAANAAAETERTKHEKAEKELREQIAALTGQVKTETGTREKLEKQLREAEEKAAAAKKDGAEAEALRGEIDGLRKQLALAAPEVADFKAAFGRAQEELNHMLDAIDRIGDEETRGKLKKAGLAMMEAYAGRLGA